MKPAPSETVLAHPLLGPVHAAHPDVDIVVLPAVTPPAPDVPRVGPVEAAALRDRAASALAEVLDGLPADPQPERSQVWRHITRGRPRLVGRRGGFRVSAGVRDRATDVVVETPRFAAGGAGLEEATS